MTYNTNRQGSAGKSSGALERTADKAQDTIEQARDKAGEIASDVRDKAGEIAGDVRHTAQQAVNKVNQNFDLSSLVSERPLAVLGAALAAGYFLGNMSGSSSGRRRETQYYQPTTRSSAPPSFSYGQYTQEAAMQRAQQYESSEREGMVGKLGRRFFSSLNSLEELFQEQLADLYDAEHQILKALPMMIESASSPELKRAFELHLQQTQGQVRRLEQVFSQLGVKPHGKTCAAMSGLVAEGQELMSMRADPAVMDAGLIASAQRVEHYEIAGYGCLRTWAQQLGYHQAVQLLQQTLSEEEQTDKQLSQLAERAINVKAAQG